jgi:serine/threonine-protein kinase RsbW
VTHQETRTFRAHREELRALAAFLEALVDEPETSFKLRLVAEELFVNTVTHGFRGDCDAPVEVGVAVETEHVVLTYSDAAPAFDPFANIRRPDPQAPLEARTAGGLGIFFITEIAARYEYARVEDRNCITMVLRRPRDAR